MITLTEAIKRIEELDKENQALQSVIDDWNRFFPDMGPREVKELLESAIGYINTSPCDPDITNEQIDAYVKYQDALNKYMEGKKL